MPKSLSRRPSAFRSHRNFQPKPQSPKPSPYSARARNFKCRRIYHVFQRGNLGRRVFRSDLERFTYLEHLFRLGRRYNVKIHNFCLMPTHIHFVLEQRQINGISDLMRELQSTHARCQNQSRNTFGNLWNQHFGCKHVNSNAYYQTLMWYLDNNPVKTGAVKKAADYKWSGAQVYAAGGPVLLRFQGRDLPISLHMKHFEKVCKSDDWQATLQRDNVATEMATEHQQIEQIFDAKARRQFAQEARIRDLNAKKNKALARKANRQKITVGTAQQAAATTPAGAAKRNHPASQKKAKGSPGAMRAG